MKAKSKAFGNRFYHEINIKNKEDVTLNFIKIQPVDKGSAAAQSLVNDLLHQFNLNYIIMTGVCAGFPERGVEIGDVVIAKQIFNYERARLKDNSYHTQPQTHHCHPYLLSLSRHLKNEGALDYSIADTTGKIYIKDYACGDKVIADENAVIRKKILEMSDDIVAAEMEGNGMLHSLWENMQDKKNTGALMVKAVSDLGDSAMTDNKEEKQKAAMLAATKVTLSLIKSLEEG